MSTEVGHAASRTARGLSAATSLAFGLRVLGIIVGMATTSVLARFLQPAGYGVLSLALTLGTAAAQLADLGIAITVAARIAREPRLAPRTLSTGLAIRTSAAVVVTTGLIGGAAAGLFGDSGRIVGIIAIATPLSAAAVLTTGAMARCRPEVASILALVQGVLWLAVVTATARGGGDLRVLAWSFVGVVVVQTAIGLAINRTVVPLGRPSLAEARRILSTSWPLAVSGLAVLAYFRLNALVLFHAKGALELGFFSAAYKFFEVAQLGPGMLVVALLPVAASLGMTADRRRTVVSLAVRLGAVVGTGTAVALIVLARPLVDYLYGRDFEPAVRPLQILGVAFVGVTLGWVGSTICTAVGVVRPIAALTVPTAALSLGAQTWVCPRWGATGAATVSAVTELVIGVGACFLAARATGARLPVPAVLRSFLLGAIAVLATVLIPLPWPIDVLAAAAVFGPGLVLLRVMTIADARRVFSRRRLTDPSTG